MWNKESIAKHRITCEILEKIKNNILEFIKKNKNTSEYDVQQFILKEFRENKVKNDEDKPIAAFNKNSAFPHYYPNKKKSKKLKPGTLILVDIWAKLKEKNAPFSDITWMAYYGKIPKEVQKVFNIIIKARNSALNFIKKKLKQGIMPIGKEVNDVARRVIIKAGYEKNIKHGTGHSIGFFSPHGKHQHLNSKNPNKLKKNLGYTIEPGIYFQKEFGVRSEINFYINDNMKLIVTTPMQKKIVRI